MSKRSYILVANLSLTVLIFGAFMNCAPMKSPGQAEQVSLSSTNIAPDEDHEQTKTANKVTTFQANLADRYYISSVFEDVFGDSYDSVTENSVGTDALNFGSACSLYENYRQFSAVKGKWLAVDPRAACSFSSQAYVSVKPSTGAIVSRQGEISHACSDLTTNKKAMAHAMKKISAVEIPELTNANLTTAFELFYRNHPAPSQGLLDSLKVMAPQTGPTLETWRQIVFTVCISSHWQVL